MAGSAALDADLTIVLGAAAGRTRLHAAVRATIETHLSLLDGLARDDQEDPELEQKVAYLTPKPSPNTRPGGPT